MTRLTLAQIRPSFDAGAVFITQLARGALLLAGMDADALVQRHASGDYGIATVARAAENDRHVGACAGLVVSAFVVARREIIHLVTDLSAGSTWMLTTIDLIRNQEPRQ